MHTALEICIDSVESALAAQSGGAQRVELCSALLEGGLTPSLGLIRAVRSRLSIPVHVMIRPRAGDFLYSADELAVMREDITLAAQAGADGVVFGLLTADSEVDVEHTRELVQLARPMHVTFHRAIDMTRDIDSALEDVIATGADIVLTSGAAPTAILGSDQLRSLVQSAGDRIRIMVGGGVRAQNVSQIAQATHALEFHAALRHSIPSPIRHQIRNVRLGDEGVDDYARTVVLADDVRELQQAIQTAIAAPSVQSF